MYPTAILTKTCVCLALLFFISTRSNAQFTVFSENFDGTVQPYTASAGYTNAECSNYVVPNDIASSVCGGQFCCTPVISSASGSGNFLFEGTTDDGPNYLGVIYQTTIKATLVARNTFTISFMVWLANGINTPVLVPQINGSNVGSAVGPNSTTGWQTFTFTYTPSTNISNP